MNRAYQLGGRIGMVVDGEIVITGNDAQTKAHTDPRVRQFIRGALEGPLMVSP
jgi:phospholipid/cholesterol/gamma-HCH transport system ATP-binding protein